MHMGTSYLFKRYPADFSNDISRFNTVAMKCGQWACYDLENITRSISQ